MEVVAIDPGPIQSAVVVYDAPEVIYREILSNEALEQWIVENCHGPRCVIEMVASYGMPVGADVFETVYWIGRFAAIWDTCTTCYPSERMFRLDVKLHLCQDSRAKDSNIRQALIDKFGPGRERAIGRKASPGPLYGFRSDLWAALGVAVTYAETVSERLTEPERAEEIG